MGQVEVQQRGLPVPGGHRRGHLRHPGGLRELRAKPVSSLLVRALPSVECRSTTVGSVTPEGRLSWSRSQGHRGLGCLRDAGVRQVEGRGEAGGEDRERRQHSRRRRARSGPGARPASRRRRRSGPSEEPAATRGTARRCACRAAPPPPGPGVSAASTVTATAIARAGPIDRKMLSEDRIKARNATITAPPAEAIASPARSTRVRDAPRLVLALPQPFAVAEQEEQDVVSADAVEHDDQDHLDRAVCLQVEGTVGDRDQTDGDLGDDPDDDDRHHRDQRAAEDQQEQHEDQSDRGDPDDRLGTAGGLLRVQALRRGPGDGRPQVVPRREPVQFGAQRLDRVHGGLVVAVGALVPGRRPRSRRGGSARAAGPGRRRTACAASDRASAHLRAAAASRGSGRRRRDGRRR